MSAAWVAPYRAGYRADAECVRRDCELERAVDAVVVGERERRVAELGRGGRELLRLRGAVEERVRRVRMQLDVGRAARLRRGRLGGLRALVLAPPVRRVGMRDRLQPLGAYLPCLSLDRHPRCVATGPAA